MKTRICPLCDQPMKKAHHCDYCNSFVWKPMYLDIHYKTGYDSGEDCSYSQKLHDYEYHENGSVTMMPSKEERKNKKFRGIQEIEFEKRNISGTSERYSTTTPDERRVFRKKGGCLKKIILIIFILTIISTIYNIVWAMISAIDFGGVPELGSGVNVEEVLNPSTDEKEYSDEEVLEMGEVCNGYAHMSITAPDFIAAFEEQMQALYEGGLEDYYEDSYNRAYFYGDEKNTYFNSSRMYSLEAEDGYYSIDWDTYSKQLHSVAYDVTGEKTADAYFDMTMEALGLQSEHYLDEFQTQRSTAKDNGYVFYDIEDLEIYISYYDGGSAEGATYYVSIDCKD